MSDKEIIDKLVDLTDGIIDHFDREDAMDMLYEVKRLIDKREESSFCKKVLEKIKAEIEYKANSCHIIMGEDEDTYEWGKHNAYTHTLSINNKYAAESEDKE